MSEKKLGNEQRRQAAVRDIILFSTLPMQFTVSDWYLRRVMILHRYTYSNIVNPKICVCRTEIVVKTRKSSWVSSPKVQPYSFS